MFCPRWPLAPASSFAFLEQRTVARNPPSRARAAMLSLFLSGGTNHPSVPENKALRLEKHHRVRSSQGRLRISPLRAGWTRAPPQPQNRPKGLAKTTRRSSSWRRQSSTTPTRQQPRSWNARATTSWKRDGRTAPTPST